MKNTVDYKSRFRILKGGKISLVVSALLVGSSLVGTSAHAICDFEGEVCTSPVNLLLSADTTLDINSTGGLDIYGFGTTPALYVDGEDSYSLTLTNAGTISAVDSPDKTAIYVTNVSGLNFTNTIGAEVNATSDSGTAVGFLLHGDSGIALTDSSIMNSGAINVTSGDAPWYEATGISLHTNGDISLQSSSISNDGDITVTSTGDAAGLDVYSNNYINITDSNITNSGNIIVQTNYGNAKGISLYSYYATTIQNATISNALGGIIDVNANYSNATGISITTGDYWSNYSEHVVDINNSTISNSGTLNVHSSYSDANGILIYGNGYSTIANSTISNDGNITVTSDSGTANGILISSDYGMTMLDSHIINDGHMTVSGEDSIGIAFGGDLYGASSIENGVNGIIDVNATESWNNASGIETRDLYDTSSIVNSGTITVGATGYQGDAYGIRTGDLYGAASILNSGTITATTSGYGGTAYGINTGDLYDAASILNSGTITATSTSGYAYGIETGPLEGNASITNEGTLNVLANYSGYGINTRSLENNASILNSNTITVTSTNSDAYGIYTRDLRNDAKIENSGTITATTTGTYGDAYGIDTGDLYYNASIENSGTITATAGLQGDAYGISTGNLYDTASILNSGTITATSTNGNAYGMFANSMRGDANITNNNTIVVSGEDATGISVQYMGEDSSITNSLGATIDVNASYTAFGVSNGSNWPAWMQDNATITNAGTINVNSGAFAVGIAGKYETSGYNASITNSGTITATIDGMADANAYSIISWGVDVTNTSTGKLYGNLDIDNGATLTNAGLISLPHNASAYVSNFNQTSTGTLEIGLLSDENFGEDGMSHSRLETNTASFADGSTIAVNVLTLSENQALLAGQTLEDVVTASTSLTLDGTLNITDNSALLNFEYFTSATADVNSTFTNGEDGAIHLNIVGGQTILDSSIAGDGNTNTQSAAAVLDAIQDGDYPAMDPVFTALNTLPTDAAVAQAVESTTPVAATASARATRQISNGVQSIVESRQRANIGEGLNSGAEVFGEKNLWIKPFASFGNQANKDGMNGFDVNTAGLGFGMDAEYASNQKIGLALFYTKAYVDVNNMAQSSNLGVFSTLVYGNIPLLDDKTNFLYQFGYAWQKTDSNRHISLAGSTANADYTTSTASVDLKVIRDYSVSKNLLLQPMVGATYRNFMSPDYAETGAGVLNLQSDKFSTDELIIGVGTLAHLKLDKDSKLVANVNVGYDTYGKEGIVTSSYEGASGVQFDTNGIDNGRWSYDLGLGYEKDVAEGHNLNFSYNYQGEGSTFRNNVLSAKYVFSF